MRSPSRSIAPTSIPCLTKVLTRDVDLGLLAGAAECDVGVLAIGLPAAREDSGSLGGDALGLVDVERVAQAERSEKRVVSIATSRGSRSFVLIVILS